MNGRKKERRKDHLATLDFFPWGWAIISGSKKNVTVR